jgi:outer membrane receptor protein involved in Fe transport
MPLDTVSCTAAHGSVTRSSSIATVDARLGLRLRHYTIAVQGQNLTNRRDPVTATMRDLICALPRPVE